MHKYYFTTNVDGGEIPEHELMIVSSLATLILNNMCKLTETVGPILAFNSLMSSLASYAIELALTSPEMENQMRNALQTLAKSFDEALPVAKQRVAEQVKDNLHLYDA